MLHIDSMRRLPAMLTLALALAFSMNALSPTPAAAQGGPVLIMGIDPENGPPGNHGPIAAYRAMINVMLSQKTNAGNGLCVIGAGKANDYVTQFWLAVAGQVPALPIALVNGAQIGTVNFSNFAIIVVAGDFENIEPIWGAVTPAEWTLLMTRKADIRRHINCGGGLVAVCAPRPTTNPNWYNFLTFTGGATIGYQTSLNGFANVALHPGATTVGQAAPFTQLLTSSTDIWHNWYTSYPPALTPIAVYTSNNMPTALGAAKLYVNIAPLANAGADRTIECTSHSGMNVTLLGSGFDANGDPLTYQWWHNGNQIGNTASINVTGLGVGTHTYTLKVNDNQCGPATSDDVVITVQDTQPPTISGVGANASVVCPADPYAAFSSPTASDACDANPTLTSADVVTPLCGATYSVTRTWTATDDESNSSSASQTITVVDTDAPVFTMNANATLWPPDHEYVAFDIDDMVAAVVDACNTGIDAGDVTIQSVWSDEPEDATGGGDGNMLDDIVLACDWKSVMLRRERQGGGNGRVYTIRLQVSDGCNTSYAEFKVSIPHNEGGPAVDDGATAGYTVSTCTLPKDIVRDGVIPAGMTLTQNYPNPFNPTTTISFTLPVMSDISLKVFDVNGREVAIVARGSFASGSHSVAFDATNLPSGMYMYRLESSGAVLSRFMQLLK